jgi:DNA-binding ferritin-like protein
MDNNFEKMERGLARLGGHPFPMMENAETTAKARDADVLKSVACDLLGYANEFHVYHWNSKTNFEHELMGEVYDLMRDTSDRLAERYLSMSDVDSFVPEGNFGTDRKDWAPGKETILSRMETILKGMDDAFNEHPDLAKFGGIGNIFSDFDEKMATIIYKYKRFEG